MRFEKWQALGNDYVIVERDVLPWELTAPRVARCATATTGSAPTACSSCRRRRGPASVATLRIFNPDGSEAELSGNGAREAILYLRARGWTDADEFAIDTAAGEIRPTILSERECRVAMGRAVVGERGEARRFRVRARADRQPADGDRDRVGGRADGARPRRGRAADRDTTRASRSARTCRGTWPTATGASARGSSSAASARRSRRAPVRAVRRSRSASRRGPARSTVALDGGELLVDVDAELERRR